MKAPGSTTMLNTYFVEQGFGGGCGREGSWENGISDTMKQCRHRGRQQMGQQNEKGRVARRLKKRKRLFLVNCCFSEKKRKKKRLKKEKNRIG